MQLFCRMYSVCLDTPTCRDTPTVVVCDFGRLRFVDGLLLLLLFFLCVWKADRYRPLPRPLLFSTPPCFIHKKKKKIRYRGLTVKHWLAGRGWVGRDSINEFDLQKKKKFFWTICEIVVLLCSVFFWYWLLRIVFFPVLCRHTLTFEALKGRADLIARESRI